MKDEMREATAIQDFKTNGVSCVDDINLIAVILEHDFVLIGKMNILHSF
jgi:hypothetical protein